ncbi:MAG: hypothetical protein HDP34_02585 [Clostridia bacterium]|nr:hypothetical protein [Clostridia bacterium]
MQTVLGKNIQKYLEDIKAKNPKIKNDAKARAYLNDKLSEILKSSGVSDRAIMKWISGEAYPEMDKLLALSYILNTSVDELLKDKELDFCLTNNLPKWYFHLSENSKQILIKMLSVFNEGQYSKTRLRELQNLELKKLLVENQDVNKEENLNIFKTLYGGPIFNTYFSCEIQDDDINFYSDVYGFDDMVKKECEKHKTEHQKELMTAFLHKNKNTLSAEHLAEELQKVADIGYRECLHEVGGYPVYYGEENVLKWDDGESEDINLEEEQETECWNEIPYFVETHANFLDVEFKNRLNYKQFENLKQRIFGKIEELREKHFHELEELNILSVVFCYEWTCIQFYDKEYNTGDYYLNFRCRLHITENEIRQILTYIFMENLETKISNMNKSIEEQKRIAKNLSDFLSGGFFQNGGA